jgi:hypothetical protein
MTVRKPEVVILDSMMKVRNWISVIRNVPFAFVLFLERRDKQNDLRYDDRSFDCEGSGEACDVGDQRFVSPDPTAVLMRRHRAWLLA